MSETNEARWYSWKYWIPQPKDNLIAQPLHNEPAEPLPSTSTSIVLEDDASYPEATGWDRIKTLYAYPSMETDVVQRVARMTFFGGFLLGGSTGYRQAVHTYEINNVGRKYLSPSDAIKRRLDYAIIRFAKSGFVMGIKTAAIAGFIVFSTTHLAAYRNRFASWYFPVLSGALACTLHTASFGAVFAFPVGIIGSAKACGLGITSGLTLAAVVQLYAMAVDKSANDAYWLFKKEYEKDLRVAAEWDDRVNELMKKENIRWRQSAVKKLKKQDEAKLSSQDD